MMQRLAGKLAGMLWDWFGPRMTFLAGAGFTALALFGLGLVRWLMPTLGRDGNKRKKARSGS